MAVRKDTSGRRSVLVEAEVPGTPEQVWRAIATGPGISSWFVPTTVEEHEGGQIVCEFEPGVADIAHVTAWDPPRRFAADGGPIMGKGPAVATEWTVEAKSGGTCIVRVVHSLFSDSDEWDAQLEQFESGWPHFFGLLKEYLERPSSLTSPASGG
jgi:uncharacterized protein YndB with AHSA1/START domain